MSSSYRIELDNWLRQLDVKAERVLDIGGSQLPIKGRTRTWDVKNYLIADLYEPHVNSPKPDIAMDINKLILYPHQADLIFCLEVFDYIWNPAIAMANISNFLSLKGTAWVTFPTFYPHHQPIEDDALRYMEGGIKKLAENAGLEITQMIKRRPESNLLDQFFRAERMRAAKHFDHDITGYIVEFKK